MRGTLSGNQEHCHRHSSKTLLTHFHNVPTLCVSTCSAASPTISLFLNREERHLSRPRSWLSHPSRQPCTRYIATLWIAAPLSLRFIFIYPFTAFLRYVRPIFRDNSVFQMKNRYNQLDFLIS